jgi:Flp pilus assembly pilin Flp
LWRRNRQNDDLLVSNTVNVKSQRANLQCVPLAWVLPSESLPPKGFHALGGSKSADPSKYSVERTAMFRRFLREEKGQDMVEYGLLAAFISIVAIAALQEIGPLVKKVFLAIQAALEKAPA